jgi:DNA repair protein RadC
VTKTPKLTKRAQEDLIISQALAIINRRMHRKDYILNQPNVLEDYLRLKLDHMDREVFGALFLTTTFQLIDDEVLFQGTLSHTQIVPREIVRAALKHNAAFVIFYHNHPHGDDNPSGQDLIITKSLKTSLATVDVKVVDHIIVPRGRQNVFSFSTAGVL